VPDTHKQREYPASRVSDMRYASGNAARRVASISSAALEALRQTCAAAVFDSGSEDAVAMTNPAAFSREARECECLADHAREAVEFR
jgi:hypothetical protein